MKCGDLGKAKAQLPRSAGLPAESPRLHSAPGAERGCRGHLPQLPNCSRRAASWAVTGGRHLERGTAGEESAGGSIRGDAPLSSCSEFEESPFIGVSDTNIPNSPAEAPTHASGTRCWRLKQSGAKPCKDSSCEGKIPRTAARKASSTSLSHGPRRHTARLNDSTGPRFCHVFYSIFILGEKFYIRKSGKADLECTFYLSKKKKKQTDNMGKVDNNFLYSAYTIIFLSFYPLPRYYHGSVLV